VRATVSKPLLSVIFWSTLKKSRLCPPSRKRKDKPERGLLLQQVLDYVPTLFKRVLTTVEVKTTANGVMRIGKAAFAIYFNLLFEIYEESH
jgi:hypothetical protein